MSRILVADDSPQALRLCEQILTGAGIEVVSVTDGAIALRRLPDVDPDLFITDVYLPSQNGFELARYMKSQAEYRDIPIVFAASPMDVFDEQDATNAGAEAVLRKPYEASLLLGAIQPLLERSMKKRDTRLEGATLDRASIRAAVTLALDAAMAVMIDELTERVVIALSYKS